MKKFIILNVLNTKRARVVSASLLLLLMILPDLISCNREYTMLDKACQISDQIIEWRRHFHMYPELCFNEKNTIAYIVEELNKYGIETEQVAGGLVATIEGGKGPVVALRGDIDALSIQEETGTSFDSTIDGVMHACGHDAHTAMVMGAGVLLKNLADVEKLPGTVRLIFQPCEEEVRGALPMIQAGVMKGVDVLFGIHLDPIKQLGTIGTRVGAMLPGGDLFEISLTGVRRNEVVAAVEQFANEVYNKMKADYEGVDYMISIFNVADVPANEAKNTPNSTTVIGKVQYFTDAGMNEIKDKLAEACVAPEGSDVTVQLTYIESLKGLINTADAVANVQKAGTRLLGPENVVDATRSDLNKLTVLPPGLKINLGYPGDDVSLFAAEVPDSAVFYLGVRSDKTGTIHLHTPNFNPDEKAFEIGSAVLAEATLRWMKK